MYIIGYIKVHKATGVMFAGYGSGDPLATAPRDASFNVAQAEKACGCRIYRDTSPKVFSIVLSR